jgi:hypothetical protein
MVQTSMSSRTLIILSQRKAYVPIEKFAHAPESVEDGICEEWETRVPSLAAIVGVRAAARVRGPGRLYGWTKVAERDQ